MKDELAGLVLSPSTSGAPTEAGAGPLQRPGRLASREHAGAAEGLVPAAADHHMGVDLQQSEAEMLVLLGDHDAAVERLAYLLSIPSGVSVGYLRLDPLHDPLRDHPDFRRLPEGA